MKSPIAHFNQPDQPPTLNVFKLNTQDESLNSDLTGLPQANVLEEYTQNFHNMKAATTTMNQKEQKAMSALM